MIFINETKKELENLQKDIGKERESCNIAFVSISGKCYDEFGKDACY